MRPLPCLLAIAHCLTACSAGTALDALDASLDCAPQMTSSGVLECPAGCTVVTGFPIDEERQCLLEPATTLACHPPGANVSGSGDIACFEREGAPTRVWSSSGSYVWTRPDGTVVRLFDEAGWTRCDPIEGWELSAEWCDR